MRALWVAAGLGALGAGLGCSGLGESLMEMTGSEFQAGDNLPMPEGFPLEAPPGGNVKAVATLPMGPMKTVTVQIEVPGDGAGLLEQYEQAMTAKGLKVTRTNTGAGDTLAGEGADGSLVNAAVEVQGGVTRLTLVSITGAPKGMEIHAEPLSPVKVEVEVPVEPAAPAEPAP